MRSYLLSNDYSSTFVDDAKYEGRPAKYLEGLACAIQDGHTSWRPSISELISLLLKAECANAIVASGMAYGAAKSVAEWFPGPAILLFGAALNVLGTAPNVELQEAITKARELLEEHGLASQPEIGEVLRAAKERATFDKVSQMLREEFSNGLRASGRYEESRITDVAVKIVKVTHDVRHKGLIERIRIEDYIDVREGATSTDIGWLRRVDAVNFTDDLLRELTSYAQIGCA
jgi:hypothetical protein